MSSTIAQLREELNAKRGQLANIFTEAGADRDFTKITSITGSTEEKVAEIRRRNTEINDLATRLDGLEAVEQIADSNQKGLDALQRPATQIRTPLAGGQREPVKSFSDYLRESKSYAAYRDGQTKTAVLNLPGQSFKTLLALTDINNVATRLPNMVRYAVEERTVGDLMLQGTTDNNTMTYMEETTFTNSAATVAEGGTKPESALDFTERTVTVRKIATWLPATAELLSDVSGIESYIRERLAFMVERTEEAQLLTGDGNAPNLTGLLNVSGVQTQAKGADPTPDAIYKAMTKVRNTGFAEPTAVVMHPNDWQDIKLLRTADGVYIWGNPSQEGPDRIWGLEVRVTTAETENTALVGAFRPMAQIFRREGISITISTEHSTYFVENKVAILAEERLALAVYRPTAFCKVTGI